MRHTLIRRFTTETNKLRRRDADGEDPEERLVPVDGPLAAVDVLTDASQYTQEKRATPGQEDFGILKPMRLPNGSYVAEVSWIIIGVSAPSTTHGQRIFCFPSHLTNLSQPVSTLSTHLDDRSLSLPPSPYHDLTPTRHPVSSSFSICMDRIWFWKGGKEGGKAILH